MAAKYHIGDDGMPGVCKAASNDSCPKVQAGDAFHGTLEEASAESARRFEEKLGAFVTTRKEEEKKEQEPQVPSALAPQDGEDIYFHPQGKMVKISADGTVRAYKDGHELKTSATAEKLRAGYGQWKRYTPKGGAAQTAVSKVEAEKMMDDLTAATMNVTHAQTALQKHYEDARAYDEANAEKEGRASYYGSGYTRIQGKNPDPKGYTAYKPSEEQTKNRDELYKKVRDAEEARNDAQTAIEEKGLGHRIPDEDNTVRVRTQAQKWLLENEMKGQISDGAWENSPNNPYSDWTSAKVIVDPQNAGRNFNTRRDNYDLTRSDLLDVVGDRMVKDVQTRTGNKDYDAKAMRADLSDLKKVFKTKRGWVDGN